jgi:hypothetical protein
MYIVYDSNGNITSIDTHKPGPIFRFIEVSNVPENVSTHYIVTDGVLVERDVTYSPHPYNHVISRLQEYNINTQLAALSDDINAGFFGEAAKTGSFITYVNAVKAKYPK